MRIFAAWTRTEGSSRAGSHPVMLQGGRGTQALSSSARLARWVLLLVASTLLSAPSFGSALQLTDSGQTASPWHIPIYGNTHGAGKSPRTTGAAGSPAKQCSSSGITLLLSTQLLSTFFLQNSEPGRRKTLLLLLPDPVQNPTHIPAHGAELLPSKRNIAAILLLTIHLCLN